MATSLQNAQQEGKEMQSKLDNAASEGADIKAEVVAKCSPEA